MSHPASPLGRGSRPRYPEAAAGWGNLKSLSLGRFKEAAPQPGCAGEMQCRGAGQQVSREGTGNLFTFPGHSVNAQGVAVPGAATLAQQ